MSSGRDVMMEGWHEEKQTDSVCEYAETALEHYMRENMKLKQEVADLKEQLSRLLWRMEEKD